MRPSIALAFVVTTVIAIVFCLLALATAIAAIRWALLDGTGYQLLRATAAWATSFIGMQGWSYYLRHAAAPQ